MLPPLSLNILKKHRHRAWLNQKSRGNVNFEIKSKFMQELREDTFSRNKNEDAHDHVDRFLNIGPIPGMTPTQALMEIQTMVDYSQMWHDGTSSRNISSNSNTDGLAAIVSKLDDLGRDMKKLKEKVHAIQVGCQICEGPHLDKECPSGYYTRTDNQPPYEEKRPSLEELMNKHQEESARRSAEKEEWIKKLQENAKINNRNQSASLKNLKTQIKQLPKELHSRTTNGAPSSSIGQCKVVNANHKTPHRYISSSKLNNFHGVSDFQGAQNEEKRTTKVLQCQFPPKELNLGNFTLSCTIGNFKFYGMADLGASVNVMPRNIFEYLRLANLRNTNMLIEMANIMKKAPLGIGLSFPDYLLAKYGKYQTNSLVWDDRFAEWCNMNMNLGKEKKGHMLDKIWEYCKDVHRDYTYWWQDHGFEEEERYEIRTEIEKYDPPEVQFETIKVTKYSFKSRQSFICVTKEVDDALPLGRKSKSRFR
ncbi:hypothetical protein Tco_1202639 [Tanacetum coccineum]